MNDGKDKKKVVFKNTNPDRYKVALTQTAKGFVYIDKAEACGSDLKELEDQLEKVVDIAIKVCNKHNA